EQTISNINQTFDGLKSISNKQLVIIYMPLEKDDYVIKFPENYVRCTFVSGKVLDVEKLDPNTSRQISLKISGIETKDKDIRSDNNTLLLNLEDIIDIIPKDNILNNPSLDSNNKNSQNLMLFNFYSLDYSEKGHNLYNIIDTDPASAYLSAKYSSNLPLNLSSISKLYPGMQFNYGRGEGKEYI
ncbi:MAG TPA: hypothetical protein V6C58_21875, partial [Allocoleopsis sp.]